LWTSLVLLFLLIVAGVTTTILIRRAEPTLRASLVAMLEKQFQGHVELDRLHLSILEGFWVEANGLRIWLPDAVLANVPEDWRTRPWIVVRQMKFHASWNMKIWDMKATEPVNISVVHVEGVQILLPPKEDRPKLSLPALKPASPPSAAAASPGLGFFQLPALTIPKIVVHSIECNEAELVIERRPEPDKPAKVPLVFEFKKIRLTPGGQGLGGQGQGEPGQPVAFDVEMVNAKPIGDIHSTGHFGPWDRTKPPGETPVQGDYRFDHADLGTIKGIAGTLASTGHFVGTLKNIDVEGTTTTPDFRLERVSRGTGLPLSTHFFATVDGTNGNTWLSNVDATLDRTHFVAKGQIIRLEDAAGHGRGHDIALEVAMDRGRIDDILRISASPDKPFLTGNLSLNNHFHLPPNPPGEKISIWKRLELSGQFHLSQARFSSDSLQGKIEQLSLRGQGKPDEIHSTDPTSILSDMQGHFQLSGGFLHLPDLDYHVPGADVQVNGVYGLEDGTLKFDGDAKLDATLSKVVGGWKGFLLKPADRFLKKNGAGTDVPIHLAGTRKEPKFGLDWNRLGKNDPETH
jgi:hypothetical protein